MRTKPHFDCFVNKNRIRITREGNVFNLTKNKEIEVIERNEMPCVQIGRQFFDYFELVFQGYAPNQIEGLARNLFLAISNKEKKSPNPSSQKKEILEFCEANNRRPKRNSTDIVERKMAYSLDNYCSPQNPLFDDSFKRTLMSQGFVTERFKSPHDPELHKQRILDFMVANKRPPSANIEEEKELCYKYNYYAGLTHKQVAIDEDFLNKIKEIDKCHGTGISVKFRKSINGQVVEIKEEDLKKECVE